MNLPDLQISCLLEWIANGLYNLSKCFYWSDTACMADEACKRKGVEDEHFINFQVKKFLDLKGLLG